ncbi:MAG: hypothetical protein ACHQJ6_02440 [Candidatus Berkiellales bacterium]
MRALTFPEVALTQGGADFHEFVYNSNQSMHVMEDAFFGLMLGGALSVLLIPINGADPMSIVGMILATAIFVPTFNSMMQPQSNQAIFPS